jgi:hypothetical protein
MYFHNIKKWILYFPHFPHKNMHVNFVTYCVAKEMIGVDTSSHANIKKM